MMIWLHRILAVCIGMGVAVASFPLLLQACSWLAIRAFGNDGAGWVIAILGGPIAVIVPVACVSLTLAVLAAFFSYAYLRPSTSKF